MKYENMKWDLANLGEHSGDLYYSQWLRAQAKRNDSVGDLARDLMRPGHGNCCTRFRHFQSLKKHILTEHNPCDGALVALERSYYEYTRHLLPINEYWFKEA